VSAATLYADLPSPKTGGVDGKPINLLVVSSYANKVPLIDATYSNDLAKTGCNLRVLSHQDMLTADYLKQFGVVILANLPYAGEEYTVPGYRNRFVEPNLKLIKEYVALGGGIVVMPAISEFGEAYGWTYDGFLRDYDARLLIQQLKDGNSRRNELGPGAYGTGSIDQRRHAISKGVGPKVLYPMNVMRWDHSYSCTPILTGSGWSVLARADSGAGSYMAIDNTRVGDRISQNRDLYAIKQAGKGMVALSAVHSYYTLTMISHKEDHVGENGTGVIDWKVMKGEKDARPSAFAKLLDNTYRCFAANSVKHGIGAWAGLEKPEPTPLPTSPAVIDWQTQGLPPTWQHRVIPSKGWPKRYDELPDPNFAGELKHWKLLIGPRTIYSSGNGSVAEYKAAAVETGYNGIIFTETFEDMSPKLWALLLKDCKDNTDAEFVCLPGLDIESYEGQRYLVLCSDRYPSPEWLTPDGKRLQAVRNLSLGWFAHVSVVARPQTGALHEKTFKHYTGIAVATYDTKGRLVDDGMFAYQWSAASDSSPAPIAVHEVNDPADVHYATKGFQQILPGPTLEKAVNYFRFAFAHAFDAPVRYYVSEGPVIDGWSMFNKDIGKNEYNRLHLRFGLGVRSVGENPVNITRVKLYDGFDLVRNWKNDKPEFKAIVDASHNKQHEYVMLASDARGRRALSPALRTVTSTWRARCGDRQNWLGSLIVYTGWHSNGLPLFKLELANASERRGTVPVLLDFPLFGKHLMIQDADLGNIFTGGEVQTIAGDAKGMLPVRPRETVRGGMRYTYFTPLKNKDFAVLMVEARATLDTPAEVAKPGPRSRSKRLNPVMGGAVGQNSMLILPGRKPDRLADIVDPETGKRETGNEKNAFVPLPAGSYAGGIVPLSDGLFLDGRNIGCVTEPVTHPKGTTWTARYLILRNRPFHWKTCRGLNGKGELIDDKAEQALAEMGFRGKLPYELKLKQGKLEKTAYFAHMTAENGGVAGQNVNKSGKPMLMHVPFVITGLDNDSEKILWRSDSEYLDYFSALEGKAYVSFDADKTVEFYAGNAAVCDPKLTVSVVIWDKETAWFRVHNPTDEDITTAFATPAAVKGLKPLKTTVTVPAGTSVEVGMGQTTPTHPKALSGTP